MSLSMHKAVFVLIHVNSSSRRLRNVSQKPLWSDQHILTTFRFITMLHCMQHGIRDCKAVCLSVHHAHELCQNERKFCRHSYTIWKVVDSSFPSRRMVGGGRPLLLEILGQTDPLPSKTATSIVHFRVTCFPVHMSSWKQEKHVTE